MRFDLSQSIRSQTRTERNELALVGVVALLLGITPGLQASMLQHSLFWITIGGGSGMLGGWLSVALAKMLAAPQSTAAAERALAGDVAAPAAEATAL